MASFDALIRLAVEDKTKAAIDKIESRFSDLQKKAAQIAIGGTKSAASLASKNLKDYANTLGVIDKKLGGLGGRLANVAKAFDFGGKTAVGIAAINALTGALANVPKFITGGTAGLQDFGQALNNLTSPLASVVDGIVNLGPAGLAAGAGIATATAAIMAFGPQARKAKKEIDNFRESFKGKIDVSQDIISEKTIRDSLKAAVAEQKKLSAGTAVYTRATEEVVALQRELTQELRRQEIIYNRVNAEQVAIAENVRRNVRATQASNKASGFADFSQRAGAQTAIDKSIRRQQERLARRSRSAPAETGPLMLPSSEMLNAAERGIKRIRSVSEQLGKEIDLTNQNARNFVEQLRNGSNEAVKLPSVFDRVNKSLDVINKNIGEAVAKAKRLQGGPAGGTGSTTPIQGRTAALRKLADLEKRLIDEVARTRERKDLQSYNTRQRRLKFLAAQEKKAAQDRAKLGESLALGVGFPALFGAGGGSITGSAIGSFFGQGFGGQIFGGAIGQAFDDLTQKSVDLAAALRGNGDAAAALEAVIGRVDTKTKQYIQNLQQSGQLVKAAGVVQEELARKIGTENAEAYLRAGRSVDDTTAALGRFISVLVALGERSRSIGENPTGLTPNGVLDLLPPQLRPEQTEIKDSEALSRRVKEAAESLNVSRLEREVVEATVAKDIERVAAAKEKLATEQALVETLAIQRDIQEGKLDKETGFARVLEIEEELETKILQIERERVDAVGQRASEGERAAARARREAEAAAREAEAAARREQQVAATIVGLRVQEFQLIGQTLDVGRTRLQQVEAQLNRLGELKQLQTDAILASTEDSRIQQAKLVILERQIELEREKLNNLKTQLLVQKEIQALQSQQQVEGLSRGLGQELERASFLPSGSQFADQSALLDLEQSQRYANSIADINNQIEIQQTLLQKGTAEQRAFAEAALPGLQRQQQLYETLLPQIFAAEQAQLKFNQTLELVQGPVNAFVNGLTSGLQGIIDGTKSVEEAFADMLRGIADTLVQTAAQMIAQYIAIGIARQFAGIGTGGTGGSGSSTGGLGRITSLGGLFNGALPFIGSSTPSVLASGGFVTRPTDAVVGDNGRGGEYVIPASKMTGAMNRFNAGASGDAVINGADPTGESNMAGGGDIPITISTGPVMQFEGKNYVSQEEFAQGIKLAAKKGESAALRKLQMSPSTRRKIAL